MESQGVESASYKTSSLTKEEKNNVLNADPNGGRCLVTNTKSSLEYCHCIPKRVSMRENETVCETSTIFILGLNRYHSSISLNGPGT